MYMFVWRIQRYFYYMKIFRCFYQSYVQFWSWCVVGFMALVSAVSAKIFLLSFLFILKAFVF